MMNTCARGLQFEVSQEYVGFRESAVVVVIHLGAVLTVKEYMEPKDHNGIRGGQQQQGLMSA